MSDQTRDQNKRSVEKLFDNCFNQGDLAVLDELVAPDYVGPRGDKGPAGFRADRRRPAHRLPGHPLHGR